jgi:type II secretion system protein H
MTRPARTATQQGFTLLELIVVMAIIALATTLTMPRLGPQLTTAKMRSAAASFASLVGMAHYLSVATGHSLEIVLSLEDANLLLRRTGTTTVMASRHFDEDIGIFWVRVQGNAIKSGNARIVFHPDGTTTDAAVSLRGKGQNLLLTLDPASGRLREG